LVNKVTALVDSKHGGDWYKAYGHYTGLGGTGSIGREQLLTLLEDAGIGSWLTRGAWADGILKELDTNSDKKISWEEFQKALMADK
jgi:hypothetical protein